MKRTIIILITAIFPLLFTGCKKPPQWEVEVDYQVVELSDDYDNKRIANDERKKEILTLQGDARLEEDKIESEIQDFKNKIRKNERRFEKWMSGDIDKIDQEMENELSQRSANGLGGLGFNPNGIYEPVIFINEIEKRKIN